MKAQIERGELSVYNGRTGSEEFASFQKDHLQLHKVRQAQSTLSDRKEHSH